MIAKALVVERRKLAVLAAGLVLAATVVGVWALWRSARIDECHRHSMRWTEDGRCVPPRYNCVRPAPLIIHSAE
jgi:hypothetical protein